jgi:hypothetical protein
MWEMTWPRLHDAPAVLQRDLVDQRAVAPPPTPSTTLRTLMCPLERRPITWRALFIFGYNYTLVHGVTWHPQMWRSLFIFG